MPPIQESESKKWAKQNNLSGIISWFQQPSIKKTNYISSLRQQSKLNNYDPTIKWIYQKKLNKNDNQQQSLAWL